MHRLRIAAALAGGDWRPASCVPRCPIMAQTRDHANRGSTSTYKRGWLALLSGIS